MPSRRPPPTTKRAAPRQETYRSGGRSWNGAAIEESLDLLADHDYENLKHRRPKHVPTRGAPTWASLAQGASTAIAADMVRARSDGEAHSPPTRNHTLPPHLGTGPEGPWGPGPPSGPLFFVFVFSRPPATSDPPGRALR